ncbi:hypothetical protein KAW18_02240 [candidate division WOR-3 bacterium]|nr:hypothetical protein [candidate division WOR-3 bacterium]
MNKVEVINSFIVDDGEKYFRVELTQNAISLWLIRHFYSVKYGEFSRSFLFKFFAKRFFTSLKKGYKSCFLTYGVYDDKK